MSRHDHDHDEPVPEGKDPVLWDIARKRAGFKSHFFTYLVINAFLWGIWYFTEYSARSADWDDVMPWPAWTSLCWGVGLAYHFASAYLFPHANATEREYEKLKNQQKNNQ